MAPAPFCHLQNIWPFSILKADDLTLSNQLVRKLSVPEHTKKFIFAARVPDSHAIVYILAVQNLSKQSALDAEQLIKEVQPNAVVCLVASSALAELKDASNLPTDQAHNVPTSSFGVLKKCLINKISKEQFEKFAKCQVLGEIFGIGLYGHFFAAKEAAEEIGSQFILLEIPYEQSNAQPLHDIETGKVAPHVDSSSSKQTQMVSLALPSIRSLFKKETNAAQVEGQSDSKCGLEAQKGMPSGSVPKQREDESKVPKQSEDESKIPIQSKDESKPKCDYEAPPFAQAIYPVLVDLHDIFSIIPAIKQALTSAQEMLSSVNKGVPVDSKVLSEVHTFRIAIEALRTTLNDSARFPLKDKKKISRLEFSQVSSEETSNAICAQAIKNQAIKFGSLVAIVDAGKLSGLRKHWTTPVPPEIADLTDQCFTHYSNDDADEKIETELMTDEHKVAVGAGATAVIRSTYLLKSVPAYALIKLATSKLPASVKFGLEQLQRTAEIGGKPSNLNLSASAEMIRSMALGLITLAEKTGLLAVQTSFYELMRRKQGSSVRLRPLTAFCCSMATCTGFMLYKDGIRCVADSVASFPTIASMGRGLESMQQASEEVRKRHGSRAQATLQSLLSNLKIKIQ